MSLNCQCWKLKICILFIKSIIMDEIRIDLVDFCYFERFVSFHTGNDDTNKIPRAIITLVDYWIFNVYIWLAQSN